MAQTDDIIAGKWITTFNIVYWRHYRKRNKNHAKTLKEEERHLQECVGLLGAIYIVSCERGSVRQGDHCGNRRSQSSHRHNFY